MSSDNWKLKRTVQCAKCPWKKSTNPFDIPGGYDVSLHRALEERTIAKDSSPFGVGVAMGCHESPPGDEVHCVGWLHNQMGEGNNIPLRLALFSCENVSEVKVVGEQHSVFSDTIPEVDGVEDGVEG